MLQSHLENSSRTDGRVAEGQFIERAGTALRSSLQAHLRQTVPDDHLRRALRSLCIDARQKDLRPEQLIVIFKEAWNALPEMQNSKANRRQELLDRIVTICIEEYYGS